MTLKRGDSSANVAWAQRALNQHGFPCGTADGSFGPKTEAAVIAFQRSKGLTADGIIGPLTIAALEGERLHQYKAGDVSVATAQAITGAPAANLTRYLPHIIKGLIKFDIADKQMVAYALATVKVETWGGSFVPTDERENKYSGKGFSKYDVGAKAKSLGNTPEADGDGAKYKGRGFIQLTGGFNYEKYGALIGKGTTLKMQPEMANNPEIAGLLLGAYLKGKEATIRRRLDAGDIKGARKVVNAAGLQWEEFKAVYQKAMSLLPSVKTK